MRRAKFIAIRILHRFWILVPAVILDPIGLVERLTGVHYNMPVISVWIAFSVGILVALYLSIRDLKYRITITYAASDVETVQGDRIISVNFHTAFSPVTIDNIELETASGNQHPKHWKSFKLERFYSHHYEFGSSEGKLKLIATADGMKYRSPAFEL